MKVTILGCGGSMGVPSSTGGWGVCDPANPKNYRRRPSVLVETETAAGEKRTILIDTSPDLREQLIRAAVSRIDAVLFTHTHADHTHGIDDLRPFTFRQNGPIQAYAEQSFINDLTARFSYAFYEDKIGFYRPILIRNIVQGNFDAVGVAVVSIPQDHGTTATTGFRFGSFAYSIDVVNMTDSALEMLTGITHWVVDCQQIESHPTHAFLSRILAWVERIKPQNVVLSHMGSKLDYDMLRLILPAGIEPGYDGLSFSI